MCKFLRLHQVRPQPEIARPRSYIFQSNVKLKGHTSLVRPHGGAETSRLTFSPRPYLSVLAWYLRAPPKQVGGKLELCVRLYIIAPFIRYALSQNGEGPAGSSVSSGRASLNWGSIKNQKRYNSIELTSMERNVWPLKYEAGQKMCCIIFKLLPSS